MAQESFDRMTRWRLLLGGGDADGTDVQLEGSAMAIDEVLSALYDEDAGRQGGLADSQPQVHRWLGDIRTYFPSSVVQVLQQDAMERLGLERMLMEPEVLEAVTPDIALVATLLNLKDVMPTRTRETARQVIAKVVADLEKRLRLPTLKALRGALSRSVRNPRPSQREIDWPRTIKRNLKHYQPAYKTVIPHQLVGYGRKGNSLKTVILLVDQSASMAASVVYAGVLGSVLASLRALKTHLVVFDTQVVDLTDRMHDPVDVLLGTQLGGGTDIGKALIYARGLIRRPKDTVLVLLSDLYEGGNRATMLQQVQEIKQSGVNFLSLLALNDEGRPFYDRDMAQQFATLGIQAFASTPDAFPKLLAERL
ncbi:MAG: VWA domain-containing protein [Bacteroidota bacterium]